MSELYIAYFGELLALFNDWWREWGLEASLFMLGFFWTLFCRRDE